MSGLRYRLLANGDSGLSIIFDAPVSETLSRQIMALKQICQRRFEGQLLDSIPAYQSLTLYYRPECIDYQSLSDSLRQLLESGWLPDNRAAQRVVIPVCYEQEFAPDLKSLASQCGLSCEQVIELHSQGQYRVHMLGFLPGFLYLGGLDTALYCARKATPSLQVPAGSVAIGGGQTGIYPQSSPGGWHVIGRTPLRMFNPSRQEPCIAQPLDIIEFTCISAEQFATMSQQHEY